MDNTTMYKLWLHEDDEGEGKVIRILDEYGRGRSKLISIALQDMIRRYNLTGKSKEVLHKFVDDFDFIRDFTADLSREECPLPKPPLPQKSEEEKEKEADKKAFGDLLSAFGGNSF